MKTAANRRRRLAGFTVVEVMITMAIGVMAIGASLSTFMFCFRTMYKDTQRLATNASMRRFMAEISKETLDASYFYLFPYYNVLDGDVNPDTECTTLVLDDVAGTEYDKWVGTGDCLVLVTNTTLNDGSTAIRQVRLYYRLVKDQNDQNNDAELRYYETKDWGVGGHPDGDTLTEILNDIDLADDPYLSGSKRITDRCRGRSKPNSANRYPMFSTESPSANPTNGFVSINIEFVNGTDVNNMLSSSSFNYTISPRR